MLCYIQDWQQSQQDQEDMQEAPAVMGFADGENNSRFLSELPIFWVLLRFTTYELFDGTVDRIDYF